ncbi:hypothetical protein J6V85_03350 [Candidatus Saccharibacteria bacterium]|nr:hypothetical protein [Candidatus Saccharibacteria bacterium]
MATFKIDKRQIDTVLDMLTTRREIVKLSKGREKEIEKAYMDGIKDGIEFMLAGWWSSDHYIVIYDDQKNKYELRTLNF